MKRLAWWAIGVGLCLEISGKLGLVTMDDVLGRWYSACGVANSLGHAVFILGAVLLAATVVADAITKAATVREGP